jgi:hypothetical protein
MRFLLYHPDRIDDARGDTLSELVFQLAALDREHRCAVVDGQRDTVTIGDNIKDDELERKVAQRALVMLERRGWVLYERKPARAGAM